MLSPFSLSVFKSCQFPHHDHFLYHEALPQILVLHHHQLEILRKDETLDCKMLLRVTNKKWRSSVSPTFCLYCPLFRILFLIRVDFLVIFVFFVV